MNPNSIDLLLVLHKQIKRLINELKFDSIHLILYNK